MPNAILTKGAGNRLHGIIVRNPGLDSERSGTLQLSVWPWRNYWTIFCDWRNLFPPLITWHYWTTFTEHILWLGTVLGSEFHGKIKSVSEWLCYLIYRHYINILRVLVLGSLQRLNERTPEGFSIVLDIHKKLTRRQILIWRASSICLGDKQEGNRVYLKGFPLPHFATSSVTSSQVPGQLLASTRDLALPNYYGRTQQFKVIKIQKTCQASH